MSVARDGREALDALYWRAEVLQALYWMRGEGIAAEVDAPALAEFLAADPSTVSDQMRRLADDGYLEPAQGAARPTRYRLTALGVTEGGRSFRDEFEGLTREAHFECGPGCWCKDPRHAGQPCPNQPLVPHGS